MLENIWIEIANGNKLISILIFWVEWVDSLVTILRSRGKFSNLAYTLCKLIDWTKYPRALAGDIIHWLSRNGLHNETTYVDSVFFFFYNFIQQRPQILCWIAFFYHGVIFTLMKEIDRRDAEIGNPDRQHLQWFVWLFIKLYGTIYIFTR